MLALLPWLPILVLTVLTTVLAFAVIGLSRLLGPQRGSRRKLMPYESGMTPIGSARRPIRIAFYLVAIEFLLFDLEIMFLYPYALIFRELGVYGLVAVGFFVFFILAGYVYAIKQGTLEWR